MSVQLRNPTRHALDSPGHDPICLKYIMPSEYQSGLSMLFLTISTLHFFRNQAYQATWEMLQDLSQFKVPKYNP